MREKLNYLFLFLVILIAGFILGFSSAIINLFLIK